MCLCCPLHSFSGYVFVSHVLGIFILATFHYFFQSCKYFCLIGKGWKKKSKRLMTISHEGKGQNCGGQKCTRHELVLLMFFVLKCLDDLLSGFKMLLVDLLWWLVRHQIKSRENKMLKEVVKTLNIQKIYDPYNFFPFWSLGKRA